MYEKTIARRSKAERSFLGQFAFALCLLGLYLQINVFFPYGLYILSGTLLLVLYGIRREYLIIWVLFTLLGAVSIYPLAFDPDLQIGFMEQVSSLGMLGLTVLSSFGLYAGAITMEREEFSKLFLSLSVLIILGALLEVAGPLAPVSDAFRNMAYPSKITYGNDLRDLATAGFVRPKFFTSEPSHLAKMLGLFLALAALTTQSPGKKVAALMLWFPGYLVVGSAAMAAGLVVLIVDIAVSPDTRRYIYNPLAVIPMGALVLIVGIVLFEHLVPRLGLGGGEIEPSAFLRIYAPWIAAMDAFFSRPLLGFGLGAESNIRNFLYEVYTSGYAPKHVWSSTRSITYGNLHAGMIIQFGIIGSLAWIWMMGKLRRSLGGSQPLIFWSFYVVLGWLVAPLNTPMFWGQIILISAAVKVSSDRHEGGSNGRVLGNSGIK